eukprot:21777-Rhodomonas_salina.3
MDSRSPFTDCGAQFTDCSFAFHRLQLRISQTAASQFTDCRFTLHRPGSAVRPSRSRVVLALVEPYARSVPDIA